MLEINKRVFLIIDELKRLGIIDFDNDFCEAIGLLKQNLNNIKNGKMSFNLKHVNNIIKKYNVNPYYIFGLESKMFQKQKS